MRHFTPSLLAVLLCSAFAPLRAQFEAPPNVFPGSFTVQLNVGLLGTTGLRDVSYAKPSSTGQDVALQVQRRIPIGEQLAVRAGMGVALYNATQESDAGPAACRLFGPDCVNPPQPLNVDLIMGYLTLPTDL